MNFENYPRIKIVHSFAELVSTPLVNGINALCWPRILLGDFAEVVAKLDVEQGITSINDQSLEELLDLSPAGKLAVQQLLADQRLLREHDLQPTLDCINGYENHEQTGPVRTDVCSFHADSATVETDTYLCTYAGQSSLGLLNEHAIRRVDIPETRAALLEIYGGPDDTAFAEYLADHCFDLHYAPLPHAQPYAFGQGNLWRIAVAYTGCPVPPCIHRAPDPVPGAPPRLLLLS